MISRRRWSRKRRLAGLLVVVLAGGCGDAAKLYRNNLDAMKTAQVRINNHTFDVWLALSELERNRGLMQVTEEQLAARDGVERGMFFAFPEEQELSFWMFNTIIPLDIAYINADGLIVQTYTMAPLETRTYPSIEPAQFALEVKAGLFARLGIAAGDVVEIPDELLKALP